VSRVRGRSPGRQDCHLRHRTRLLAAPSCLVYAPEQTPGRGGRRALLSRRRNGVGSGLQPSFVKSCRPGLGCTLRARIPARHPSRSVRSGLPPAAHKQTSLLVVSPAGQVIGSPGGRAQASINSRKSRESPTVGVGGRCTAHLRRECSAVLRWHLGSPGALLGVHVTDRWFAKNNKTAIPTNSHTCMHVPRASSPPTTPTARSLPAPPLAAQPTTSCPPRAPSLLAMTRSTSLRQARCRPTTRTRPMPPLAL